MTKKLGINNDKMNGGEICQLYYDNELLTEIHDHFSDYLSLISTKKKYIVRLINDVEKLNTKDVVMMNDEDKLKI